MATKVDICNMALALLGDTATVTSIDPPEGSAQADHCARFYPIALRDLLVAFPWHFATKRSKAAKFVGEVLGGEDGEAYYALPSDCLRVLSVESKLNPGIKRCYSVERSNKQVVIVTDAIEPIIKYITSEVGESGFPSYFTSALVHRLAALLAGPLVPGSSGIELANSQLKQYDYFLGLACSTDAREGLRIEKYRPRYLGDAQPEMNNAIY